MIVFYARSGDQDDLSKEWLACFFSGFFIWLEVQEVLEANVEE